MNFLQTVDHPVDVARNSGKLEVALNKAPNLEPPSPRFTWPEFTDERERSWGPPVGSRSDGQYRVFLSRGR